MHGNLRGIKEEHILHAVDQLDKYGWEARNNSTKFDLLYNENRYPPKMIIRHACIASTGEEPGRFGGGKESNELLIRFGFTIVDKATGLPIGDSQRLKDSKSIPEQELRIEEQEVERIFDNPDLSETEKIELVKIRIGQGIFRKSLLSIHTTCMLCNVNNAQLLIASHIKPWRDCASDERLDVNNGLLLCPNHDSLFDKGFITFDDSGQIVISTNLSDMDRLFLNVIESMKVNYSDCRKEYMKWHRTHVFNMK